MKTIFKHTLLPLALLAGVFTAQAQVKIGSSPTTIAPTSNLEVQATNGKKVIVDKAVGTVQVENLPAGDATNKIVTADGTGVLKQVDPSTLTSSLSAQVSSMSYNKNWAIGSGFPSVSGGGTLKINFVDPDFDKLGVVDLTNDRFKITKSGYYCYRLKTYVNNHSNGAYLAWVTKNNTSIIERAWAGNSSNAATVEMSTIIYLNVDDYLEASIGPCDTCGGSTGPYQLHSAEFSLEYLGN